MSIPRVALRVPTEAAKACGVSDEYFNDHIRRDLKLYRRGALTLVTVDELARAIREGSERTLDNGR